MLKIDFLTVSQIISRRPFVESTHRNESQDVFRSRFRVRNLSGLLLVSTHKAFQEMIPVGFLGLNLNYSYFEYNNHLL